MATTTTGSKRRRTSSGPLHISDLPDGILSGVAIYLPKISRALLAAALSPGQLTLSWRPTAESKAIFILPSTSAPQGGELQTGNNLADSEQCRVLDFGGIERSLASKLTDVHVNAILMCTDAVRNVTKLKLTGCVNITGNGLGPIRGSTVLEQIDLSLVGQHERQEIEPAPKISCAEVVPILDSIVGSTGNSLKHIQFPESWRSDGNASFLAPFIERYSRLLERREMRCSGCGRDYRHLLERNPIIEPTRYFDGFGQQRYTCCVCLKGFCERNHCHSFRFCRDYCECERRYCNACVPPGCITETSCRNPTCKKCLPKCNGCKRSLCTVCNSYSRCEGESCNKIHCDGCFDGVESDVKFCENCGSEYCHSCRLLKCKEAGEAACAGCLVHVKMEPV